MCALCSVGIGGSGLGARGVVNVLLIKRNDPDFKKVNIFAARTRVQWWGGLNS